MKQIWKQHGVGTLVTCAFAVLVPMGIASGQPTIYVNCPSQTVTSGIQAVTPGGVVVITGACPEALTISKPLTLKAQGPGPVMIGAGVSGGTPVPPPPDVPLIYHLVAEWSDPLTPPQSRTSCIGWFEWGVKTCSEWKTEWRHMNNRLYIRVDIPNDSPVDKAEKVYQCFDNALISGVISGIITAVWTGGSAAIAAAEESFVNSFSLCIYLTLTDFPMPTVSFPTWSGWSDWG